MDFSTPIDQAHVKLLKSVRDRIVGDLQYRLRVFAVIADQNGDGEAALYFPATTATAGKMALALLDHPRENWSRVAVYEIHIFRGSLFASTSHTYRKFFNRSSRTEVFTRDGKVFREKLIA